MNTIAIALLGMQKRFGSVQAVNGVDLEICSGEFFSLLGPSGCGKTTLLRLIAGFETPDAGEVRIGGQHMNTVPPRERPVNTVFQNYALFPHLSVFENVAFGLRVRKAGASEVRERVCAALELLHVADLKDRLPAEISGGQKQRVALARALVVRPQVLLLDEPLAAVDARRRSQVQEDLRTLQRETRTTFLYVTHDQDEALSLSDRLAVMDAGKIVQLGKPREIYETPKTRFVASFIGRCNTLPGTVMGQEPGYTRVQTALGCLHVEKNTDETNVLLGIRSERVLLNGESGENVVGCTVSSVSYTGALTEYCLDANGIPLRAAVKGSPHFAPADRVQAALPSAALFFMEDA